MGIKYLPERACAVEGYPKCFYKYDYINDNNFEYIKRLLSEGIIYLASPAQFNDPFDCKIFPNFKMSKIFLLKWAEQFYRKNEPKKSRSERRKQAREKCKSSYVKKRIKNIPNFFNTYMDTYSLSVDKNNLLLWSHYANSHRGFCIEFDSNFANAVPVNYTNEYPNVKFEELSKSKFGELIFCTKAELWQKENEWRVIEEELGQSSYSNRSRYMQVADEYIKSIILGYKICDKHKTFIQECIKNRKPKPTLYKTEKAEKEFALIYERID